jgi:anti-sigma regulatory factor (Ser/Thr protein kinase)/predicted transcriptional regulator
VLRVNRISGVPVVDGDKLVGVISVEDFIGALADGEEHHPVEDKMSRTIQTLFEDDPLSLAIDKFDRIGLGRFPVVEREGGKLVGIVTKGDLIKGMLRKLEGNLHEEEVHHYRASHVFDDIDSDAAMFRLEYRVTGKDFKRAGEGASRLKKSLGRLGIRSDIVRRLAIASYEAEMNLVIFTDGGKITACVRPSNVVVDVEDSGPGIPDVEQAMQPGYSTATDWVRELGFGAGMGLPNIKNMSDEFDIDSELGRGTHLRLLFFTQGDRHAA